MVEENKSGSKIGKCENGRVNKSQILKYLVCHVYKGELLKNFSHGHEYSYMHLSKFTLIMVWRMNGNKG